MLHVPTTNPAPTVWTRALTFPSPSTPPNKKRTHPRRTTSEPDAKLPARIPRPQQAQLPDDIGKYVVRDAKEVTRLGWVEFSRQRRGRGDFASLAEVKHLARRLLRQYKHRDAPVVLMTGSLTEGEIQAALKSGPHRSATEHTPFLREEFASMVEKGKWVVLPYLVAKGQPGLRLSPPGVKVEREQIPPWLGDYSYFKTNAKTIPVACLSAMQYGRALDSLIRKIVYVDPALGYIYMLKADVSDGFYLIGLRPEDAPKLGLIFPSGKMEEPMVAIPLKLPMGWKNFPHLFCTATETVAYLANKSLRSRQPSKPHKLDDRAEAIALPPPPPLSQEHPQLTWDPYLRRHMDVFIDDFL